MQIWIEFFFFFYPVRHEKKDYRGKMKWNY